MNEDLLIPDDVQRDERIRALNDELRRERETSFGFSEMTTRVALLPDQTIKELWNQVASFDKFYSGQDAYDLHEYGVIEHGGHKVSWEIGYYDNELNAVSGQPESATETIRVLTLDLVK